MLPNGDVNGNNTFYLLFADLNAISNLNSTFPCVRVDYSFSGLQGTAAFHAYGYIKSNGGISWTNRVDGFGSSGYYVAGPSGNPTILQGLQEMVGYNNVYVTVSNKNGPEYNDFANNTYFMKFARSDSGLNSVHITIDPKVTGGQVTNTSNMTGTFYVNFTGDRDQDDFILSVAVNGTINNDFQLRLQSSVP